MFPGAKRYQQIAEEKAREIWDTNFVSDGKSWHMKPKKLRNRSTWHYRPTLREASWLLHLQERMKMEMREKRMKVRNRTRTQA